MAERHLEQMKAFITLTEGFLHDAGMAAPPLVETAPVAEPPASSTAEVLVEELNKLVFKLRAHIDESSGDYAHGVEAGMVQASDMIENIVRRHFDTDNEEDRDIG